MFPYNYPNNAKAVAELEKEKQRKKELDKMEEANNPTNQNLKRLLKESHEQNVLLESHNKCLREELDLYRSQIQKSDKELKQSKRITRVSLCLATISTTVAIVSMILTIIK